MSHWTHKTEHGDVLIIKDTEKTVTLYTHTPIGLDSDSAHALDAEEAVAVFNLTPEKARELADWLILYAKSADSAGLD